MTLQYKRLWHMKRGVLLANKCAEHLDRVLFGFGGFFSAGLFTLYNMQISIIYLQDTFGTNSRNFFFLSSHYSHWNLIQLYHTTSECFKCTTDCYFSLLGPWICLVPGLWPLLSLGKSGWYQLTSSDQGLGWRKLFLCFRSKVYSPSLLDYDTQIDP